MDGIYAMYFTGAVGSGHGLIMLSAGTITGADAAGVLYDGSYSLNPDRTLLTGSLTMQVPSGTSLVTGASAGEAPLTFEVPLSLPANLGNGRPLPLKMATGTVNVIFKKLRELV